MGIRNFDIFGLPPAHFVDVTHRRLETGWLAQEIAVPAGSLTLGDFAACYEDVTFDEVGAGVRALYAAEHAGDYAAGDSPITVVAYNPNTNGYSSYIGAEHFDALAHVIAASRVPQYS